MRRRSDPGGAVTIEKVQVRIDPDAVDELGREAEPYLRDMAALIGRSIVTQVPVDSGVMARSYSPTVDDSSEPGEVHLYVGSPFWHWLEYGTATSPVYRPVQRGVEATGARYEPA